jgi:hypothetical protein
MSHRAIEMQIALPRTQDAGQLQEQLQQRGQIIQSHLAQEHLQEERVKRNSVNSLKQRELRTLQNSEQKEQMPYQLNKKGKKKQTGKMNHPYLGNNIDFNG